MMTLTRIVMAASASITAYHQAMMTALVTMAKVPIAYVYTFLMMKVWLTITHMWPIWSWSCNMMILTTVPMCLS